jgi:hypothetical protein
MPRDSERIRWMTRGVALGILAVCACGLTTRLAPDVWPIAANLFEGRLSYPITYWNSLGLLAATGTILCFHFTSSYSERGAVEMSIVSGSSPHGRSSTDRYEVAKLSAQCPEDQGGGDKRVGVAALEPVLGSDCDRPAGEGARNRRDLA